MGHVRAYPDTPGVAYLEVVSGGLINIPVPWSGRHGTFGIRYALFSPVACFVAGGPHPRIPGFGRGSGGDASWCADQVEMGASGSEWGAPIEELDIVMSCDVTDVYIQGGLGFVDHPLLKPRTLVLIGPFGGSNARRPNQNAAAAAECGGQVFGPVDAQRFCNRIWSHFANAFVGAGDARQMNS